jgi:IS6 family transposase
VTASEQPDCRYENPPISHSSGAIDQFGQVIDVFVSPRRDLRAARRFLERGHRHDQDHPKPVVTDQAPTYPVVLEKLLPARGTTPTGTPTTRSSTTTGRLKARRRSMRGLKQDRSARIVTAGPTLVQKICRGHYELAVEAPVTRRVAVAFDELAWLI